MKKRFWANKYLLSLVIFGSVLMISPYILFDGVFNSLWEDPDGRLLFIILYGAWPLSIIAIGDQVYAIVTIEDDYLSFSAWPRHYKMEFKDIAYIGIDYGNLSATRQFFIYVSKSPISMKYFHNMTKMPYSKDAIKIQYSDEIYNTLLYRLPPHLKVQLEKGYSVIKVYGKFNE